MHRGHSGQRSFLGAGPYRAQVFRTILDLNESLRPAPPDVGCRRAPLLRVSAPKAAAPSRVQPWPSTCSPSNACAIGSPIKSSIKSPQASRTCGLYFHIWCAFMQPLRFVRYSAIFSAVEPAPAHQQRYKQQAAKRPDRTHTPMWVP